MRPRSIRHAPLAMLQFSQCAIVGGPAPTLKTNECGALACYSVMACPGFLGCNELTSMPHPAKLQTSPDIESHPMRDQFSNTQAIRKPAVTSKGGIVAAQSSRAAQVGAEVLAAGGDCVDAVIATTFALGVLEPWMSGLGGGGAMVLYRAREDRYEVIDYGMRAPASLRLEDYPLTGGGAASDIFPWPRIKDDRNLHGPGSIAVPGVVAGMEEAHRRHAKLPWKELLTPSVKLAGEGLAVDWWTTLMISSAAADLRRYPASAAAYLQDGLPPNSPWRIKSKVRMPQDRRKATMAQLTGAGTRDF